MARSAGSIFSAYVGSPRWGTGSGSGPASSSTRSSVPTSTNSARSCSAVVPPGIGTLRQPYTGPVSSVSSTPITHTPVTSSPASRARSTGAAPRHRGSSEKWTLIIGSAASTCGLMIRPKATTTPSSAAAPSASSTSWDTGRPSSSAAALTGLGEVAVPRPRRRSGRVTTSATSWPAATSARSGGTAISGVPRKTSRNAVAVSAAATVASRAALPGAPPAGGGTRPSPRAAAPGSCGRTSARR